MANPIILIPVADGHVITHATIESINRQTLKCDIVAISRPKDPVDSRRSEGESRKLLIDYAIGQNGHAVFFMMDRNVVIKKPDLLEGLFDAANTNIDRIVHVKCKNYYAPEGHMDIEFMAWPFRMSIIAQEAFDPFRYQPQVCWCEALSLISSIRGTQQVWFEHSNL